MTCKDGEIPGRHHRRALVIRPTPFVERLHECRHSCEIAGVDKVACTITMSFVHRQADRTYANKGQNSQSGSKQQDELVILVRGLKLLNHFTIAR